MGTNLHGCATMRLRLHGRCSSQRSMLHERLRQTPGGWPRRAFVRETQFLIMQGALVYKGYARQAYVDEMLERMSAGRQGG